MLILKSWKVEIEIENLYVKHLEFENLKIEMFEFRCVNFESWKLKTKIWNLFVKCLEETSNVWRLKIEMFEY